MNGAITKEKLGRCKNFIRENTLTWMIDILFLVIIYTGVLILSTWKKLSCSDHLSSWSEHPVLVVGVT